MTNDSTPMDGMTRSAVLMMSLGEDAAAEVFAERGLEASTAEIARNSASA